MANKGKTGGLNYSKTITFECQLGEAERERDRQEADAKGGKLQVWWSRETLRQVLWQINLKIT